LRAVHWLSLPTALVATHLVANVVWIGALLSVALLVGRAPWMADPAEVGMLARRLYARLAVPAFLGSVATGLARFLLNPQAYIHLAWLHAKLALASVKGCSVKLLSKENFGIGNIIEIWFAGNQVRLTRYRGCSQVHIELVDASCKRSVKYKDVYGVAFPISKHSVTA